MNNTSTAKLFLDIGYRVRESLMGRRANDVNEVRSEGGDTIFGLDFRVEATLIEALHELPATLYPLQVVCEGLGPDGRLTIGSAKSGPGYCMLIDPVDGTRELMYDKRSAWFLATLSPDKGSETRLQDALVAVMVELPTSKQGYADAFWAIRDGKASGARRSLLTNRDRPLQIRPSSATSLRHGFAYVSSFFPGTKILAAELMETIARATLGEPSIADSSIFDDQYISTSGQMVELLTGKDRFCCDLRPLFYRILNGDHSSNAQGLSCHPYDMAGSLVATNAGVILTDGFGKPLNAPFDVNSNIHWCGYANQTLRDQIEPVIQDWLRKHIA